MTISQHSSPIPVVLTIAGSDSGGGAGIQADIKAISATGSYACSVITAITAQNTRGVSDIFPIPPEHVASQLDAVFEDLHVAAVKIGMLADPEIIQLVADRLRHYQPRWVVLDPVMVATSGDVLLPNSAILALQEQLLPLASVMTPNLPEAAALTGCCLPVSSTEMQPLVQALRQLKTAAILLKGGHWESEICSDDWLILPDEIHAFPANRIRTRHTHGTGCTLSSAIASYLAQGLSLVAAIAQAKHYVTSAIQHADALQIGQGRGPVDHFFQLHEHAVCQQTPQVSF